MEEYDFLVIGSGSGLDVANAAANQASRSRSSRRGGSAGPV